MIIALVVYIGSGPSGWHESYPDWSFPLVEATYAGLGIGLGILWGVLRPVGSTWLGGAILGGVFSCLVYSVVLGPAALAEPSTSVPIVLVGSIGGVYLWAHFRGRLQ